jgi:hypothetical protein
MFWNHFAGKRLILPLLLITFTFVGCIASLRPGLTVDDATEQKTFRVITTAAKSLLSGRLDEYNRIKLYHDRYYGIGFDLMAYPFQVLLQPSVASRLNVDEETALLLARRPPLFLLFAISVVAFYRHARWFTHRAIAATASAAYATCPYLFGHAMINLRDSPFMAVYLICTYLSLRLVKRHLAGRINSYRPDVVGLALATATLVSIRIPGFMILVQYAFTFALAAYCKRDVTNTGLFRWQNLASFSAVLLLLVVLLFPAVWLNPLPEIFAGMKYVGWFYQPGCTLTWGECMEPHASVGYLWRWLAVKLPVTVLVGIVCTPFMLKRIWRDPFHRIAYLTLLFGSVYVLLVIIPLRARLYDETRQLLFIYPLLFLIAFIALRFLSPRLTLGVTLLTVAMFSWDQVRLHPYQYVYFNEYSRFLDIDSLFETDYWGISAREHARVLQADSRFMTGLTCLYADPVDLYRPFIDPNTCLRPLDALTAYQSRNGIVAYQSLHGIVVAITCSPSNRFRFKAPATCWQIASSITRKLPLSNRVVTMSAAYYCSPLQ